MPIRYARSTSIPNHVGMDISLSHRLVQVSVSVCAVQGVHLPTLCDVLCVCKVGDEGKQEALRCRHTDADLNT